MWIEAFLLSVNPMSGAITHLPFPGSAMQQPMRAAEIWGLLQSVYMECMPKADALGGLSGGG